MSRVVAVIDRKEGIGSPRLTYDGVVADLPDGTALVTESLLAEAERAVAKLKVENRLKTRAVDRWVPCPDHRDKTDDQGCYVCRIEKLQRKNVALQSRLDAVAGLADRLGMAILEDDFDALKKVHSDLRSAALGGESPANDEVVK